MNLNALGSDGCLTATADLVVLDPTTVARTKGPKRQPWVATNQGGTPTICVPIAGCSEPAVLFAEDFERLCGLGVTPNWHFNSNGRGSHYVRFRIGSGPSRKFTLA